MSSPPDQNLNQVNIAMQTAQNMSAGNSGTQSGNNMGQNCASLDLPIPPTPEAGGLFNGSIFGAKNFDETMSEALHGGLMHSIAGSGVSSVAEVLKSEQASGFSAPPGAGGLASAKPGIGGGR